MPADAVKIQTYEPDTLTLNSNKPDFCREGFEGRSLGTVEGILYSHG